MCIGFCYVRVKEQCILGSMVQRCYTVLSLLAQLKLNHSRVILASLMPSTFQMAIAPLGHHCDLEIESTTMSNV